MKNAEKEAMRREADLRRRAAAEACPDAGDRLRDHLVAGVPIPDAAIVAAFWPMGNEIDVRPTMEALLERGNPVCLPIVEGRDRPLVFRDWTMETVLEPAGFNTSVPPETSALVEPDVLLVPLLAFDRDGFRLGYGAGYYDRTLSALRAEKKITAVGVAYAAQEVPAVPREAHDQPLDWIVTESGAWPVGAA
jgi:5-formyltetrahydrofolate cyclo-ligase